MGGRILAPWCVDEKWEFGKLDDGRGWAKVSGRNRAPKNLTSNWGWMVRNDYEEKLQPWFHGPDITLPGYIGPSWDDKKREFYWTYVRNPLQNARLFTWGWADRNYIVTVDPGDHDPDPMTIQRNDKRNPDGTPQLGYQRATLVAETGEKRQWVSYCSSKIVWYAGTQPTGFFGLKLKPGEK